jgi:hypothetical protein
MSVGRPEVDFPGGEPPAGLEITEAGWAAFTT